LLNTCQQVGGGLGLAVFGTLAATATRHRLDQVAPGSGSRLLSGTAGPMPLDLRRLVGDALAHGYGIAYLVASATVVVAAVLAVLSIQEVADPETAVPSA